MDLGSLWEGFGTVLEGLGSNLEGFFLGPCLQLFVSSFVVHSFAVRPFVVRLSSFVVVRIDGWMDCHGRGWTVGCCVP